jgi:GNAT superfamily N-acetyltransferase
MRLATPADEPTLSALVQHAYAPWIAIIGQRPAPMLENYAAQIAAGQVWLADDARAAIVLKQYGETLFIDNVAVAPEAQGKGVGRALIAFAETEARRLGLCALTLSTHVKMMSNIALYRHLGFDETHRLTEDGFDRVYMRRDLD